MTPLADRLRIGSDVRNRVANTNQTSRGKPPTMSHRTTVRVSACPPAFPGIVLRRGWIAALGCCLGLAYSGQALGGDWPHWRGPTRDGITKESSNWTSGDWLPSVPEWTASVGSGTSAPLVYQGRVYVIGWEQK